VAFTGDAVLGEGSVFVAPDPGALAGYLAGLRALRERGPAVICPGHGPVVDDPAAKIDAYVAHRLDRERRLVAALDAGLRTINELIDEVWSDAPAILRPASIVTLAAHLDKLDDEGRLPEGVERPTGWPVAGGPGGPGVERQPGGQQQLTAGQERGRVNQLADVHPGDHAVDIGSGGAQLQLQLRHCDEITQGQRHGWTNPQFDKLYILASLVGHFGHWDARTRSGRLEFSLGASRVNFCARNSANQLLRPSWTYHAFSNDGSCRP